MKSHSQSQKSFPPLPPLLSSSYQIISELGRGTFSTVYKIKYITTNQYFCLKIITLRKTQDKHNEINLLQNLSHPNLVQFISSFCDENNIYIIMEFCQYGDLYSLLHSVRKKKVYINENIIWDIAYQSLLALDYLHKKHIIHRDIKLLNIFMGKDKVIKIGDFGMSKLLKNKEMKMSRVGTPLYLAPELVKKEKYDYKADIWSLGCSLYHLAKTIPPFNDDNLIRLGYAIVNNEPERIPECYSEELELFIKKLMMKNSKDRPSAEKCINLIPNKIRLKYMNKALKTDEKFKENGNFCKTVGNGFELKSVNNKNGNECLNQKCSELDNSKSLGFAGQKLNKLRGFNNKNYFQINSFKSCNNNYFMISKSTSSVSIKNNKDENITKELKTSREISNIKEHDKNTQETSNLIYPIQSNKNNLSQNECIFQKPKIQNKTIACFYKPRISILNKENTTNINKDTIKQLITNENKKVLDNTDLYNKYIKKDIDFFNNEKIQNKTHTFRSKSNQKYQNRIIFPQILQHNQYFVPNSTIFGFNTVKANHSKKEINNKNNLFRSTFNEQIKISSNHKKTLTIHDFK